MPLYDFICRACGKKFEVLVLGGETPVCPACRSADLKKQMSTFSARTGGSTKPSDSDGGGSGKCSGCAGGSCSSCH